MKKNKDNNYLKGRIVLEEIDENGKIINKKKTRNLVVDNGVDFIYDLLSNNLSEYNEYSTYLRYFALGRSPSNNAKTQLGVTAYDWHLTEEGDGETVLRVPIESYTISGRMLTMTGSFPSSGFPYNPYDVSEFGVFLNSLPPSGNPMIFQNQKSRRMFNRGVFIPPFTKVSGTSSLRVTYNLRMSNPPTTSHPSAYFYETFDEEYLDDEPSRWTRSSPVGTLTTSDDVYVSSPHSGRLATYTVLYYCQYITQVQNIDGNIRFKFSLYRPAAPNGNTGTFACGLTNTLFGLDPNLTGGIFMFGAHNGVREIDFITGVLPDGTPVTETIFNWSHEHWYECEAILYTSIAQADVTLKEDGVIVYEDRLTFPYNSPDGFKSIMVFLVGDPTAPLEWRHVYVDNIVYEQVF